MKLSTFVKLASALLGALAAIGGAAEKLPDGKTKYVLVTLGMVSTSVPALWSQIPSVYQAPTGQPIAASQLEPGDVLLYRPVGIFGLAIAVKTWHRIAHIEIYVGNGQSVASRDGLGTGVYPLRLSQLAVVCRPLVPLDVTGALDRFKQKPHRPYGWLDLVQFIGVDVDSGGIVCSPFGDEFIRDEGLIDFLNCEEKAKVAPFEFMLDQRLALYDVQADGTMKPRPRPPEVAHAA